VNAVNLLHHGRRLQVMRHEQREQWALVVHPTPPRWPYEETLVFPRLPADVDNELLAIERDEVWRILVQLASVYQLDTHNLVADVRNVDLGRRLNVNAKWIGVGFEAGLGRVREFEQQSLGLPRVSP
jgi:hypothetical protein